MRLLVFDPSLNCTGFAVIDTSKRGAKRIVHYGHIPNTHLEVDEVGIKLVHIEMIAKALGFAFRPDCIVVEELTGNKFNDIKSNAKAHGVIEKVFANKNIVRINNKKFKSEFVGNGNAKKEDVANKVLEYVPNLHFATTDESDAIGIGIYYSMKLGECKWNGLH